MSIQYIFGRRPEVVSCAELGGALVREGKSWKPGSGEMFFRLRVKASAFEA